MSLFAISPVFVSDCHCMPLTFCLHLLLIGFTTCILLLMHIFSLVLIAIACHCLSVLASDCLRLLYVTCLFFACDCHCISVSQLVPAWHQPENAELECECRLNCLQLAMNYMKLVMIALKWYWSVVNSHQR